MCYTCNIHVKRSRFLCFQRLAQRAWRRHRRSGEHVLLFGALRPMKWITRERVKVDRVACPWLIKKFVDEHAEFYFVPADKVTDEAQRLGATPFDVKGVELGHHRKECSFQAILEKHNLDDDPALDLLGKIVNGADTDNTLWNQPKDPGLEAMRARSRFRTCRGWRVSSIEKGGTSLFAVSAGTTPTAALGLKMRRASQYLIWVTVRMGFLMPRTEIFC